MEWMLMWVFLGSTKTPRSHAGREDSTARGTEGWAGCSEDWVGEEDPGGGVEGAGEDVGGEQGGEGEEAVMGRGVLKIIMGIDVRASRMRRVAEPPWESLMRAIRAGPRQTHKRHHGRGRHAVENTAFSVMREPTGLHTGCPMEVKGWIPGARRTQKLPSCCRHAAWSRVHLSGHRDSLL
jgi:hypothetical protein